MIIICTQVLRRRKNAHALQVGVAGAVMKLGEVERKKESMEFSLMQQKDGQQIDVIILRTNHVFSHSNNTIVTSCLLLLILAHLVITMICATLIYKLIFS